MSAAYSSTLVELVTVKKRSNSGRIIWMRILTLFGHVASKTNLTRLVQNTDRDKSIKLYEIFVDRISSAGLVQYYQAGITCRQTNNDCKRRSWYQEVTKQQYLVLLLVATYYCVSVRDLLFSLFFFCFETASSIVATTAKATATTTTSRQLASSRYQQPRSGIATLLASLALARDYLYY